MQRERVLLSTTAAETRRGALLCQQVAGSGVRCLQLLSTLTLHCFIPLHSQKRAGRVVDTQESVWVSDTWRGRDSVSVEQC
ncbi:hypothetical protein ACRRTK_023021 [Alexandromys fortis]